MGLFTTVQWIASLAFAAPLAIMGVEFLGDGEVVLGALFFGLAALMLLLPEYIQRRIGGRAKRKLGGVPLVGRRFRDGEN